MPALVDDLAVAMAQDLAKGLRQAELVGSKPGADQEVFEYFPDPLQVSTREEAHELYAEAINKAKERGQESLVKRQLALSDLFYLLVFILNRPDVDRDWLFDRCREVQRDPDGRLDLWARDHYKSTIITFGLTIQDILKDPEVTIGIFSHTRPIAKGFLRQIKREFEGNELLKDLFPDVLWKKPKKESPKWSEDEGIVVKRKSNPKESTLEAFGLVDGQPTSRHYKLMEYDDPVTKESVTEGQIPEVLAAWALSRNLISSSGGRTRYIGTRYHQNDLWGTIIEREAAIPREHPATVDGTAEGDPVFISPELLAEKRREMGSYTFSCQMLMDPVADEAQGFKLDWLQYWPADNLTGLNIYLLCDPASSKEKDSDYTCFMVIGLGPDENYYIIDMFRDRINLTERARYLFYFHREYKPIAVGYEKYGLMADIEHFKTVMERENYRFDIIELGGRVGKLDRIRGLVPKYEDHRVFLPFHCVRPNYEKQQINLVKSFVNEEYLNFPVSMHDDMLDCQARILDEKLGAVFPKIISKEKKDKWRKRRRGGMVV